MPSSFYKIGEIARQTGLSIRTLRYYDEIGLLKPSSRTESKHRVYDSSALQRLQQIQSLRSMGFPLHEVEQGLKRPGMGLKEVLQMQIMRMQSRILEEQKLCNRLERLVAYLAEKQEPPASEIFEILKGMTMFEKYYTPEQLETLRQRGETLGAERIREVEQEWPELIAKVQAAIQNGVDPASPEAQALGRRWMELVQEFTGGDPGIAQSLRNMYQQEPQASQKFLGGEAGAMQGMMSFVQKAVAAAKSSS